MQCKKLEQIIPIQPIQKRKYAVTAQTAGDVLLLDVFKDGSWHGRQAIHTQTGEYAQYSPLRPLGAGAAASGYEDLCVALDIIPRYYHV